MTVGQWIVVEDIKVADICFNDIAVKVLPEVYTKREKFIELLKKDEKYQEAMAILSFFSSQFAKKDIKTHNDYKISALYANKALESNDGIIYPSVRADFEGQNIALPPITVERNLKFDAAGTFRCIKNKDQISIDNIAGTRDFGPMNSAFKWRFDEQTPEWMINKMIG